MLVLPFVIIIRISFVVVFAVSLFPVRTNVSESGYQNVSFAARDFLHLPLNQFFHQVYLFALSPSHLRFKTNVVAAH